jgi:arylsulfatase A-like enzyme
MLPIYSALLANAFVLMGCSNPKNLQVTKPNIIVIVADDLGWSDLSCYGNSFIETPNLDKLAKSGLRFTNAYAAASLCSPSRASLLTGNHPVRVNITEHTHGPFRPNSSIPLITPDIDQVLKLEYYTIGEMLKREAYRTGYIGKWHLGGGNFTPKNQGFDFTYAANYHGLPRSFYHPFFPAGSMPDIEAESVQGEFLTDKLTDKALQFVANPGEDPFFLFLSYYAPHVPIEGRADLEQKYIARRGGETGLPHPRYAAMVEGIDQNVGRLVAKLNELGKLNNTLIIFTSDNGGLTVREVAGFDKHTPPTTNTPLRSGKGNLYEGGIRVPLIAHWPDMIQPNRQVSSPVSGIDLYNTFVDVLGKADKTSDGTSFYTLLKNGEPTERALFWHVPHYSPQGGKPASAIRKGKFKLIQYYETNSVELFNLELDPSETTNVYSQNKPVGDQLLKELNEWKTRMNAKLPKPNPGYKGG